MRGSRRRPTAPATRSAYTPAHATTRRASTSPWPCVSAPTARPALRSLGRPRRRAGPPRRRATTRRRTRGRPRRSRRSAVCGRVQRARSRPRAARARAAASRPISASPGRRWRLRGGAAPRGAEARSSAVATTTFPHSLVGDPALLAVGEQRRRSRDAEARLHRARRVVEASVDDPADRPVWCERDRGSASSTTTRVSGRRTQQSARLRGRGCRRR